MDPLLGGVGSIQPAIVSRQWNDTVTLLHVHALHIIHAARKNTAAHSYVNATTTIAMRHVTAIPALVGEV